MIASAPSPATRNRPSWAPNRVQKTGSKPTLWNHRASVQRSSPKLNSQESASRAIHQPDRPRRLHAVVARRAGRAAARRARWRRRRRRRHRPDRRAGPAVDPRARGRLGIRVLATGDRLAPAELLEEIVEQVAHQSASLAVTRIGRDRPLRAGQGLDRAAEGREDRIGELVRAHRRGTRRLETERRPDREGRPPGPFGVVRWYEHADPHLESAGILEDEARERS